MTTDRVKAVMAVAFNVPAGQIPDNAVIGEFSPWDSVGHMQLMLELESVFGVSIPSDVMFELLSLADIEAYLKENGVFA